MTIKEIKKAYGLTNADIAKAFDYKSTASYAGSSARPRIDAGIEWVVELILSDIKDFMDNRKEFKRNG